MRSPARRFAAAVVAAVCTLVALTTPAAAGAAGVAYLDGKEVWASNLSGTAKVRLSGGEGDWVAVAQSDQGYVVGVRHEAGKIFDLSTFVVWDPAGKQIHAGPIVSPAPGASNAYPLSIDLTPDGSVIVYGYSSFVSAFPVSNFTTGFLWIPSSTVAQPALLHAYKREQVYWPTLVGTRVVGTKNQVVSLVQDTLGVASEHFTDWINTAGDPGGPELHRTDVAASGTVAALEYAYPPNGSTTPADKVLMLSTASLGGAISDDGQCYLPATGAAEAPSLLQDGSKIAWGDAAGVRIGGTPAFTDATGSTCTLGSPVVTISPTGSWPSLGPIDVDAIAAVRAPAVPGGGPAGTGGGAAAGGAAAGGAAGVGSSTAGSGPNAGAAANGSTPKGPAVDLGRSLKLSALRGKAGARIEVTAKASGQATVTVTVEPKSLGKKGTKPVVIASGKATVVAGKATKIKVRATKSGKKALKKLKRKKATVTVSVGGETTVTTTTLK